MNKKIVFLLIIAFSVGVINLSDYAKGFYVMTLNFETDKTTYYNDESINISLTWEMMYDVKFEDSYIEIRIELGNGTRLWTSPQYSEMGINEENWIIGIQNLGLGENFSNYLYIRIFLYNYHDLVGLQFADVIREIQVETVRRNVSCELIGFDNHINYGEDLDFKAIFYNISDDKLYLVNSLVSVEIVSENNQITYNKDYITNSTGEFEISILSIENLTEGLNYLKFGVQNNQFEFQLYYGVPPLEVNSHSSEKSQIGNKDSRELLLISIIGFVSVACIFIILIRNNYVKKTTKRKFNSC